MRSDQMFCCDNCKEVFFEPVRHREVERETFWGAPVFQTNVIELCPACNSENISEIAACVDCGLVPAQSGYDCCGPCQAKADESERLADTLLDIARSGAGVL